MKRQHLNFIPTAADILEEQTTVKFRSIQILGDDDNKRASNIGDNKMEAAIPCDTTSTISTTERKTHTNGWSKFTLLLWKNWTIQKRHKIQTVVEIVLPVFFASLLVIIRDLAPADVLRNATIYPGYAIDQLPDIPISLLPSMNVPQLNGTMDPAMGTPRPAGLLPPRRWPVAWVPNNTAVADLMDKVARKLNLRVDGYGFGTEEDMVNHIMNNLNGKLESNLSLPVDFLGGIVFLNDFPSGGDKFPKDIKFKIRLRGTPRVSANDRSPWSPVETWNTEYQFPFFQLPGPRFKNKTEGGKPCYYKEGFLTLQDGISRTITEVLSGKNTSDLQIVMRRYPYPAYADDKFIVALQGWLPLIIMLSFIYPALNIVKSIVHEKERRLKEAMKMMGLPNWLHWTAWFVKSLIFLVITVALITILLKVRWYESGKLAALDKVDGFLLFVSLLIFVITSICFCFLISVFFSKANSAATGAGIIWFLTYCPYFFLQLRYATLTRSEKLLSCLLSNTAVAFGMQLISMFEGSGAGIQWDNLNQGISPDDNFTFGDVLIMMSIDAVIYLLLALYIEAVFPGEFGVPQPWYFPFTKTFWCSTHAISDNSQYVDDNSVRAEFIENDPVGLKAGVQIQGLTKTFPGGKAAVRGLHINMYEGQITALLGHNGAGKSTTMSMLTGLYPPSSGTALVNGHDIRRDIEGVRGSLGLCPQHDVLFDELTVEEHLDFFCKLKGYPASLVRSETSRMVKALQLENKRKAKSVTLSGGMKRKLSVGIALCGDSKVVMLDEPTSGMDPSARRSTWDLLQKEKTGRTILLTTHFMEEADLLGDRVAIMASGQIQCCGSSLFLKKKYGAGYHLVIVKDSHCDVNRITEVIRHYIPEVTVDQDVGAELSYVLSSFKSHLFEKVFDELERNRKTLGINSYGASVTTMEEVFIRVGQKAFAAVSHPQESSSAISHSSAASSTYDLSINSQKGESINTGFLLFLQQFRALLVKKSLYTFRNWLLFLSQLLIPVVFLIICLVVVRTLPGVENSLPLTLKLDNYITTTTSVELAAKENELARNLTEVLSRQLRDPHKILRVDAGNESMIDYYLRRSEKDLAGVNLHSLTGVTFETVQTGSEEKLQATGWFNNQPFHVPPLTLNLIHNALLALYMGDSNYKLTVINHPLPFDDLSRLSHDTTATSLGFQVGFNISFGMAFLAASFVLFLVKERVTNAKHLQFVSGVNFVTFWLANFLWDFVNFAIPCVGILITFLAFNEDGFTSAEEQGRFVLIFVLYGWAMLPLMYLLSYLFSVPASGFTRVTMFNLFTGMATLIAVVILQIPELELLDAAEIVDWIFLALPNYSLGMAFNNLYGNARAVEYCTQPAVVFACKSGIRPNPCCKETGNCGATNCIDYNENLLGWEGLGIGRMLVFLAIDGVIFFVILILSEIQFWDKVKRFFVMCCRRKMQHPEGELENGDGISAEDEDVVKERNLIHNRPMTILQLDNHLIINDLTKYYDNGFLAVDRLCLGVRRGECFGLLGINGAGKTTTFKMLTGDIEMSAGDAYLDGFSVSRDIKSVQRRLGYCPQFDALIEELTGRETLRLFARLRGIPEKRINSLIEELTDKLLLRGQIHKKVKELSGGNKRKLSTAVALVGEPPIVFLDEPTTGMDPVARRQLWDTITNVRSNGQAVVLTSHSMEECEALCTRIGIMVNGHFKCLGSAQHLKSKYGQGYTLIAKIRNCTEPSSSDSYQQLNVKGLTSKIPDMGPFMEFIRQHIPGAELKDYHQGLVHYHLPEAGVTWARIFGLMESAKDKFHIEDYSVGQTTLEQVFLNFAKNQAGEEAHRNSLTSSSSSSVGSRIRQKFRPKILSCSREYIFQ